jgi:hypothetical protein
MRNMVESAPQKRAFRVFGNESDDLGSRLRRQKTDVKDVVSESGGDKSSNEKHETATKKPTSAAQARESVERRVWEAAGEIADGLVEVATEGQLATAKYLFELAGVSPAAQEGKPQENSLPYVLLKRLGLPTEPMSGEAGSEQGTAKSDAEGREMPDVSGTEAVEREPTRDPKATVPTLVSPQHEINRWASAGVSSAEDAVE